MANADTPAGARPVMHRNGAPYNGAFRVYAHPAGDGTALMIGDFVKLAGTGETVNGRILQVWAGNDLLRTVLRDTDKEVRKKRAARPQS